MLNWGIQRDCGAAAFVFALAPLAMATSSAMAGVSGPSCVQDQEKKVCVSIENVVDTVQVSAEGDSANTTYQLYEVVISDLTTPQATRNFDIVFAVDRGTFDEFADELTPEALQAGYLLANTNQCAQENDLSRLDPAFQNYATPIRCTLDKLDYEEGKTLVLPFIVATPETAGVMNALVEYGWKGNTGTLQADVVAVNEPNAFPSNSYIPKCQDDGRHCRTITLYTSPEVRDANGNPQPQFQTTPADPLWAKVEIPPQFKHTLASVDVIFDGPSQSLMLPEGLDDTGDLETIVSDPLNYNACVAGVLVQDGQAYLCRDTQNDSRWVKVDAPDWYSDMAARMKITVIWDDSIVSDAQLEPNLLGGLGETGTPPFAMFYRKSLESNKTLAFADQCSTAMPPCLSAVNAYDTGDWMAVLEMTETTIESGFSAKGVVPADPESMLLR